MLGAELGSSGRPKLLLHVELSLGMHCGLGSNASVPRQKNEALELSSHLRKSTGQGRAELTELEIT